MEAFVVDRSLYDITSVEDFKDLWETEMDPTMQEVLKLNSSGDISIWSYMEKDAGVVIHDRLMTDAVLGTRPIKTEHSYSLSSDGDSLSESPMVHQKLEMEDECFPPTNVNGNKHCSRVCRSELMHEEEITVKEEPLSETDTPNSSNPSSPQFMNTSELHFDVEMANAADTGAGHHQSLIKLPANTINSDLRLSMHKKPNLKNELVQGHGFHLPPTPPSCSGSSSEDSEDNTTPSQPPSPSGLRRPVTIHRVNMQQNANVPSITLSAVTSAAVSISRQPIHTPLISNQPKGSTGTLILTEEEKRTLIAEGYPVPTRLPLTKAEEKSLKKIRRKIKNKISAQESRRKKKEYMDQLERRVDLLLSENNNYRNKIESLEDSNTNLLCQLQKLQTIVARTHPQLIKQFAIVK